MSRRPNSKLIKTEIDEVFTADSRAKEIEIPVFSFSGPVSVSVSPPWYPSAPIRLTRWQIAAATMGTGQSPNYTHFQILLGDSFLNPDGEVAANGLLEAATMTPFGNTFVPVPRTYSYKRIYNLNGYVGRERSDIAFGIPSNENIVVSSRQFIKVGCVASSGHEDVTVKIYGVYVDQTNDSGLPNI